MIIHQLPCAIRCDDDMNRKIIGVYASNDIPKKKYPLPYGLIVNTDPHHPPGKHWVAFYIDERGLLETFDSYGIPPSLYSPLMERFMNYFEEQLIKTKRLRGSETRVCGQYCILYLMWRCKGYSMKDIINIFDRNFKMNDQFVYNFIDERCYCCMHTMSGFCQICVNKM